MSTIINYHGVIIEEDDQQIRFTLPDWLTPEDRRGVKERLDSILLPESRVKSLPAGPWVPTDAHRPEPDVPGYCTCGTLTRLCGGATR